MTCCSMSGRSNRWGLVFILGCAALLAGTNSTFAVGLVYVDGRTGSSFGEPPNVVRSNGASLGTPGATDAVTSETNLNTDNAWGWRDFRRDERLLRSDAGRCGRGLCLDLRILRRKHGRAADEARWGCA